MKNPDILQADAVRCEFFGPHVVFHHLGMAVRSIEAVSPQSEPVFDPIQKVRVAFVDLNGVQVELIEARGEASPIRLSLERGIKLLHMCYAVPDLESTLQSCRTHGFHTIRRPTPAVAFGNRRIAWVSSKDYGLVELLEDPTLDADRSDGEDSQEGTLP